MASKGKAEADQIRKLLGEDFYKAYRTLKKKKSLTKSQAKTKKNMEQQIQDEIFIAELGIESTPPSPQQQKKKKKKKKKKKSRKKTPTKSPTSPQLKVTSATRSPQMDSMEETKDDRNRHQESEQLMLDALRKIPRNERNTTKDNFTEFLSGVNKSKKKYKEELDGWNQVEPMKYEDRVVTTIDDVHFNNRLPRIAGVYKDKLSTLLPVASVAARQTIRNSQHKINPDSRRTGGDQDGLLINIPERDGGDQLLLLQDAMQSLMAEENVMISGQNDARGITGFHIHSVPVDKLDGQSKMVDPFEMTMRFAEDNSGMEGDEFGTLKIKAPDGRTRLWKWGERVSAKDRRNFNTKHNIHRGNVPSNDTGTSLQQMAYQGEQVYKTLQTTLRANPSSLWGGRGKRKMCKRKTKQRRKKRKRGKKRTRRYR